MNEKDFHYELNEKGEKAIKSFLRKHHKNFRNITERGFCAWFSIVEENYIKTNDNSMEISGLATKSGRPEILSLPHEFFDKVISK